MIALAWSLLGAAVVAGALHAPELGIILATGAIVVRLAALPDPRHFEAKRRNRAGDRW